jgi:hypothetical protein
VSSAERVKPWHGWRTAAVIEHVACAILQLTVEYRLSYHPAMHPCLT